MRTQIGPADNRLARLIGEAARRVYFDEALEAVSRALTLPPADVQRLCEELLPPNMED